MIGHDAVNAALEGMNLLFETFSRKGRKMPRLSIKVSDKNLIKVASLNGKRQHWCSYWIVPAIPNEGPFPVPAGFRFSIDKDNRLFVENEAGDHKIQLFEGDYLAFISPSIRSLIAEPEQHHIMLWLSKGIFVSNPGYFNQHWEPAEENHKSINELIARGTLIDTPTELPSNDEPSKANTVTRTREEHIERMQNAFESAQEGNLSTSEFRAFNEGLDYFRQAIPAGVVTPIRDEKLSPHWHELENSVFDSESSAQSHPDFKDFHHIVINEKNPSLRHLNLMEHLLRQQGRAVIDTLNPSKEMLDKMAGLLMGRSYLIYKKGQKGLSDLAWAQSLLRADGYHVMDHSTYVRTQDINYEAGYAAASRANRRRQKIDGVLASRAYQTGFEAGRIVEKLGILNGEESHDREERESASEGDSRVGGTFPFTGSVTGRFSSRHAEKLARHGANFRDGTEGFRESESRSYQTTQWADSEQPQYSEPGEPTGDSIHQADGEAAPQRDENEKGNA